MFTSNSILQFKAEIEAELTGRIMLFWMERTMDEGNGGFYGQIANDLKINKEAAKGCILNSRILWTFAAAYRIFKNDSYRTVADRAYEYLLSHFWDNQYFGLYFMLDHRGVVIDPRKQLYNLAFGIYGLSEYYRATGIKESLRRAIQLFQLIEQHYYDRVNKGYYEACSRDWLLTYDMRLSKKDLNEKKTMNSHLHLMEAYTNLLRVWDNDQLRHSLDELIQVTINHIISPQTCHFNLFFDESWNPKLNMISFGHDIEGSWLLTEAATVMGDEKLFNIVKEKTVKMAQKVYEEGLDNEYGGLFNEFIDEVLQDPSKVWWPQCEAMVGFINAFELTGKEYFLKAAYQIWRFIDRYLVDRVNGEWFGEVSRDGKPNQTHDKVGPWKCPYHNGRACMEIISRLGKLNC